jgi:hypothetical protein
MKPEDISNIAWFIWMTVLAAFGLFGYIQLKKIIELESEHDDKNIK